jgi:hypothetical protein
MLTDKDLPRLHEQWIEKFVDLCGEIPLRLLPVRPLNHEIHLIDPDKQYNYCLPKCANHYNTRDIERFANLENP